MEGRAQVRLLEHALLSFPRLLAVHRTVGLLLCRCPSRLLDCLECAAAGSACRVARLLLQHARCIFDLSSLAAEPVNYFVLVLVGDVASEANAIDAAAVFGLWIAKVVLLLVGRGDLASTWRLASCS